MKHQSRMKVIFLLLLVSSLAACSSIPKDEGITDVESIYERHIGKQIQLPKPSAAQPLSDADITKILSEAISLSDAERLSIWANPSLKATLSKVGVAEADYAQAGRMENPGFAYERFSGSDYTKSVLFDIGGVLLMPLKRRMESRRLKTSRYQAASNVFAHISATRNAWFNAVAEKQHSALLERALESAETGNHLTRQMAALGHSSVVDAAESELFLGELRVALTRQRLAQSDARERLVKQLGLWGVEARNLKIPDQLPKLPEEEIRIEAVERHAIETRLDVKLGKLLVESMGKNLKLTRLNPFISAIEAGPVLESAEGDKERGYEIEFRIPLFDIGDVKSHKAKILYEQSMAQAEATAIKAASSARQALKGYQVAFDIANQYRSKLLPLKQRISDETMLRYNGMLISVFDLLKDVRSSIELESNYVDALKEFWIADTGLQQAIAGVDTQPMDFAGSGMKSFSKSDAEGH